MAEDKEQDAKRKQALKDIIRDLHAGKDVNELRTRFADIVKDVGGDEIPRLEQELVRDGLPQQEVARLCDVHVQVFKSSLDKQDRVKAEPGHPVHTLQLENDALVRVADDLTAALEELGGPPDPEKFPELAPRIASGVTDLAAVDKHYLKKENQVFPFLEKHGVTAPPQVMWVIHDQVRNHLAKAKAALQKTDLSVLSAEGLAAAKVVKDMIYKEENILFPMIMNTFEEKEWVEIRKGEPEIGYALIIPGNDWAPGRALLETSEGPARSGDKLAMDTGELTVGQLNLVLKSLPADVTFVDENDEVRYYSDSRHRIFPRSKGIIGRKVQFCHPPKSVHMVNKILDEFRAGRKSEAEFWIRVKGRLIYINYIAVRDDKDNYKGTIEFTQDVTDLKKLEGEKRLLDWEK